MMRIKSWLQVNPIIIKELRSRMRGPRGFITLTVTLILMAGVMYGLLQIMLALSTYSTDIYSPRIGQAMFTVLAFLELFMVCAITPAVTAGAISGEREKLTYEMLQSTPLSPAKILWGKLFSALIYVFLLLFAAVPLASLVFIFGGVAPRDMLKALLVLVLLAVSFGVLGLFMSALFGRTGRATVASFLVVMGLLFVPLLIAIAISVVRQGEPPRWILAPSPLSMLSSVLGNAGGQGGILSGIIPILGGYWVSQAISPISQVSIPRPLYHYSLPLYLGITLVLYLVTTRLLQPAHRWRFSKKEILVTAGLLLGFAGVVAGGYFATASRYEWVKGAQQNQGQGQPQAMTVAAVPVPERGLGGGMQPTPAATLTPAKLQADEQANVYAAIARQLYTVDHTFGDKPPLFPMVYLIRSTNDQAGDPSSSQSNSVLIAEEVQKKVTALLSDLPAKIEWVDSEEQVPKDSQTGAVQGGGVILKFGNIYDRGDGQTFQAAGSIYIAGLAGGGKTYILEQMDGKWKINGTTGVEWIS